MKNRTKGVIAGLTGLALLTGGTTFALWQDQATAAGGVITNGNLDVATVTPLSWYDTSTDRTDVTAGANTISGSAGHAISDITTWRLVPGDKVEGNLGLEVALSGDNLVATLGVGSTALTGLPAGVTVTYDVYRAAQGAETTPQRVVTDAAFGAATTLRFAAPRTGQAAGNPANTGTIVVSKTATNGTANVWVVVKVAFAAGTTGSTAAATMNATTTLGTITATLSQVRTGTDFTP